jgi:hypothetical protein
VLAAVALGRWGDQQRVAGTDVARGARLVNASVTVSHQKIDLCHQV